MNLEARGRNLPAAFGRLHVTDASAHNALVFFHAGDCGGPVGMGLSLADAHDPGPHGLPLARSIAPRGAEARPTLQRGMFQPLLGALLRWLCNSRADVWRRGRRPFAPSLGRCLFGGCFRVFAWCVFVPCLVPRFVFLVFAWCVGSAPRPFAFAHRSSFAALFLEQMSEPILIGGWDAH